MEGLTNYFNAMWYGNTKKTLEETIKNAPYGSLIMAYELNAKSRAFASFASLDEFITTYEKLPKEH